MKKSQYIRSMCLIFTMLIVPLFGQATPVRAASYDVACNSADLIAAIEAANATPSDDTINLTPGCDYVLTAVNNTSSGANGLPVIMDAATAGKLTINGNGPKIVPGNFFIWLPAITGGSNASIQIIHTTGSTIERGSGAPDFRILMVASGGNLTLDSVTVQNGNLPALNGGGIYNAGTLKVTNGTFSGNTANYGGGIFSLDNLSLTDSTISGNTGSLGDGIFVSEGTANLTNTTFSNDSQFTCPAFPYTVPSGNKQDLIDAILCANSSPRDNEINLTYGTYTLTTANNNVVGNGPAGLPVIPDSSTAGKLTIHGNGATIERSSANGTPDFRILWINSGADLTLEGLTMKNGLIKAGDGNPAGGGIYNAGILTLINSSISGNSAEYGGGVVNDGGTLTVTHSTFSNNTTLHDGAGINSAGMTLVISNSTFSGNVAQGLAGGIIVHAGTVVVTGTTFSSNSASEKAGGAGMLIVGSTATISGCTFSDNHSVGAGGGLFTGDSTVSVDNSTFVNNSAYAGGGIWSNSTLTVTHSTIFGNKAHADNNQGTGGGISLAGGTLDLGSSLVAGNTADTPSPDISGSINSLGYNLIGDTTGATITGSSTGNLLDAAASPANLGPLQNNGGPTQTMALLPGSVAIDAGDPAFTPPPAFDQRGAGFPRVANGRIDIGAYEK